MSAGKNAGTSAGKSAELLPDEKIEIINDGLSVIRSPAHLPFGSDALLLSAFLPRARKAAELGAGTGAVSLLAAARGRFAHIDAFELQESAVSVFERNIALNRLGERISAHRADLRALPASFFDRYDCVFSNPPYMKTGAGRTCASSERQIARHETAGDIFDFARAAARLLKTGGSAVFVWRPDRTVDLFDAMRSSGIEPKRALLVFSDAGHTPSVILTVGKKGSAPGLCFAPPFILRTPDGANTPAYDFLLEKGVFPDVCIR